jgi:adenylyltransferase/sulfurtransferase
VNTGVAITGADVQEDRFSRYRLLRWWDQEKIAATKVLVVGAGALGNEILKNLALLGFRRICVVDLDHIEISNLSRSVLFRDANIGRSKAETAAAAVRDLYAGAEVQPIRGDILLDIGLGLFRWADVIIAGLDNREARLWINRAAWKMQRPWIDGAIEGLTGVARVFLPGAAPCYECTLGETDWAILNRRMSCNLLTQVEMDQGRVPTTPTTSSVVAGIQVQEALKLIHGLPVLAGRAFVFDGMNHSSYAVSYTENPDCLSHYSIETVIPIAKSSSELSLGELYERACCDLGSRQVTIEFSRDLIQSLSCPECKTVEDVFRPVGAVSNAQSRCAKDGAPRSVHAVQSYSGRETFGSRSLRELGMPPFDIYVARAGMVEIGYLIEGDAPSVLGSLS